MRPPGIPLPATLQTLLSLVANDRFSAYLSKGPPLRRMRLIGVGEIVAVRDPVAIKQLLTASSEVSGGGGINRRILPQLGPDALMLKDGEEHLRLRRLLLPSFQGDVVREHAALVERLTEEEIGRWPIGEPFAVFPAAQRIALEVILGAVIGVSNPPRLVKLRELLPSVLEVSPVSMLLEGRYPALRTNPLGRRLPWIRARNEADRLLREEIAVHRATAKPGNDVLSRLIAVREEGEDGGLSDDQLADQLMMLLLAGHETTAATLAWCFERLVHNPAVMASLEADLADGDGSYLDAVVDETLRTRPVVEVTWRLLAEPLEIGGYRLEAGTVVVPTVRGVQLSDEHFAAAEEFRPERFLDSKPEPYTLIPFGGGTRRCLGASFATMEIKTALRVVLTRLRIEPASEGSERVVRYRRFAAVPSRGGRIVAQAR